MIHQVFQKSGFISNRINDYHTVSSTQLGTYYNHVSTVGLPK
jgi:hypothetical protein